MTNGKLKDGFADYYYFLQPLGRKAKDLAERMPVFNRIGPIAVPFRLLHVTGTWNTGKGPLRKGTI